MKLTAPAFQHKAPKEKRRAERVPVATSAGVSAEHPRRPGAKVTCPAKVHDLSLLGASLSTRLPLRPGQWVDVDLRTDDAPRSLLLPPRMRGRALVRRVASTAKGLRKAALQFSPDLGESMEFAMYMACQISARQDASAHAQ